MTVSRITGLLIVFGLIALAVVHLRIEETRTARRIQTIQMELVEIRRDSWATQLAIARLKAPSRVEKRVEELELRVLAPYPPAGAEEEHSVWVKVP